MPDPAAAPPIVQVTALVDWNSQVHATDLPDNLAPLDLAERTLSYVGRVLSNTLFELSTNARFDVTLRLYGGWHKGFEASVRRRALITAVGKHQKLATKSNVLIRPTVEFGDRLITASINRLHPRLNIHLADTYRRSIRDSSRFEEKMVDTALAADMVDLAYSDPQRWIVVMGEDDDLIPPLMVASGARSSNAGRVAIVRKRNTTPFLRFEDLRIAL